MALLALFACFDPGDRDVDRPPRDTDSGGVLDTSDPVETGATETGSQDDTTDTSDTSDSATETGDTAVDLLTLLAVEPSSGSTDGGERVTIAGTGFDASVVVTFGAAQATVEEVQDDRVVVVTPAAASEGTVDVRVEDTLGVATLASGFTYVEPCDGVVASPSSFTVGTGDANSTDLSATLSGCATGITVSQEWTLTDTASDYGAWFTSVPATVDGTASVGIRYDGGRLTTGELPLILATDQGSVTISVLVR